MDNHPGKFIVIYGINNLGKTTQAKLLVEKLNYCGLNADYLKYPIYDLAPSGPILNNYLRQGNTLNLTAREAQILFAFNRTQYEKTLKERLAIGVNVVAEDYAGTGIAWGIGAGVDEKFLKNINSHLLKEDIAFLFAGDRFLEATENNHRHETNDELMNKVKIAHLKLGEELGWIKVRSDLSIELVHERIWNYFLRLLMQSGSDKKLITDLMKKNLPKIEKISPWARMPEKLEDLPGFTLYSADYGSLNPGEKINLKTGLKITLPKNYLGIIYDHPANQEIQIMAKVIDASFKKEIILSAINISQDILHIAVGQKIAQLLIQKLESTEIIEDNAKKKG